MSNRSDATQLAKTLKGMGYDLDRGSGHWKVKQNGKLLGVFPTTPSDYRSLLNAKSELRKVGIDLREEVNMATATKPRNERSRATAGAITELLLELGWDPSKRGSKVTTDFVRHVMEVGDRDGLRNFKTYESAAATFYRLVNADGNVAQWTSDLFMATVRDLRDEKVPIGVVTDDAPDYEPPPRPVTRPPKDDVPLHLRVLAELPPGPKALKLALEIRELEEK